MAAPALLGVETLRHSAGASNRTLSDGRVIAVQTTKQGEQVHIFLPADRRRTVLEVLEKVDQSIVAVERTRRIPSTGTMRLWEEVGRTPRKPKSVT